MTAQQPTSALRLMNRGVAPARLRFRCGSFQMWDTWAGAGSVITVPRIDDKDIMATALVRDPHTGVAYAVPTKLAGDAKQLVVAMTLDQGAQRFTVERQACAQSGQVCLVNLTTFDVHFSLRILNSPFTLDVVVAPQATQSLALAVADVSATIDGITLPAVPITLWAGDIVIGTPCPDKQDLVPTMLPAPASPP
jgi:hypothetical protein